MDREAWRSGVHGVWKSQTWLSDRTELIHVLPIFLDFFLYRSLVSESACQRRRCKRHGFDPWVGKIPWRKKWQPAPVFLPRKSHGQKSLAGYIQSMGLQSSNTEHVSLSQSIWCSSLCYIIGYGFFFFLNIVLVTVFEFFHLEPNTRSCVIWKAGVTYSSLASFIWSLLQLRQ